ncbi:TPA: hypothetical protein NIY88_004948 [Klebsiella pneumoniae]|nr:hypothetical protein [Klebsiella pneumoniae]HCF8774771.1 hypothetical protein [Klebsiella pneumoniae]HCF9010930.1 hypothetical protein [Klebsiella pneumoniae]
MKLAPQSGDILRQYKALINARRRDAGQGGNLCRFRQRENPGRLRLPERDVAAPPAPRTLLFVVSRCCPGIRVLSGISSCKADR